MKVIQDFCQYLSDYKNWGYGFNITIGGTCYFYYNDPMFRVHVEVDKWRGEDGYVSPEPEQDYEWLGVGSYELKAFKAGNKMSTRTLMNAQWLKIVLYYGDQVVHEARGMRLDNEKADIAYPDYNGGYWRFTDDYDIDGLPYYISILLGEGSPTIDRDKTLPKCVTMP